MCITQINIQTFLSTDCIRSFRGVRGLCSVLPCYICPLKLQTIMVTANADRISASITAGFLSDQLLMKTIYVKRLQIY